MTDKRRIRRALGRMLTGIGAKRTWDRHLKLSDVGIRQFDLTGVTYDASYAIFEEYFRGDSESITERQERYLTWIQRAYDATRLPILDVGCGRGETLALCKEHGIEARGIDINELFFQVLKNKGFDVTLTDVISYLESTREGSLGGVVVNSVIEHLDPTDARRLIELSAKAIAPGGCLILETNNPESPFALGQFWLDPTHVRPYHAQTLTFWMSGFSFGDVVTQYRTMVPWRHRRLFGRAANYQEYIVVGYRSADVGS